MTGSTAGVGAPAHPTFAQVKGLLQTNRLAVALRLAGARTMLVHIANIKGLDRVDGSRICAKPLDSEHERNQSTNERYRTERCCAWAHARAWIGNLLQRNGGLSAVKCARNGDCSRKRNWKRSLVNVRTTPNRFALATALTRTRLNVRYSTSKRATTFSVQ